MQLVPLLSQVNGMSSQQDAEQPRTPSKSLRTYICDYYLVTTNDAATAALTAPACCGCRHAVLCVVQKVHRGAHVRRSAWLACGFHSKGSKQ
jgi:hypothetical protein